jgi:hypothetical protein
MEFYSRGDRSNSTPVTTKKRGFLEKKQGEISG